MENNEIEENNENEEIIKLSKMIYNIRAISTYTVQIMIMKYVFKKVDRYQKDDENVKDYIKDKDEIIEDMRKRLYYLNSLIDDINNYDFEQLKDNIILRNKYEEYTNYKLNDETEFFVNHIYDVIKKMIEIIETEKENASIQMEILAFNLASTNIIRKVLLNTENLIGEYVAEYIKSMINDFEKVKYDPFGKFSHEEGIKIINYLKNIPQIDEVIRFTNIFENTFISSNSKSALKV